RAGLACRHGRRGARPYSAIRRSGRDSLHNDRQHAVQSRLAATLRRGSYAGVSKLAGQATIMSTASKQANYSIWIEAEEWAPGEWNPFDANSDVLVSFEHGRTWVATFFSYKNIQSLVDKYRVTGESLSGKYFWASDLILVDEV